MKSVLNKLKSSFGKPDSSNLYIAHGNKWLCIMSNLINENDRSVSTGKIYPIDLASPKITIVKSVTNSDVKMAHILPGQPKTTSTGQIITHTGAVGLMRPSTQILSSGVVSQPQMIVSGSPVIQGVQIVSQRSQVLNEGTIFEKTSLLSPPTQIISQGTQLPAQVSSPNTGCIQTSTSTVSGTQVLNLGGSLLSGTTNLVVSSSMRALPSNVRVLPPLSHHNSKPVNVSNTTGVLVTKTVTSHVPRGLAAGASLAVRPVTPGSVNPSLNAAGWGAPRAARIPSSPRARAPTPATTAALLTPTSVITAPIRGIAQLQPTPRPLPLLQRNYQPAKLTGAGMIAVGNSAPAQYYELPRPHHLTTAASVVTINPVSVIPQSRSPPPQQPQHQPQHQTPQTQLQTQLQSQPQPQTQPQALTRATILRKREAEGSSLVEGSEGGWEDIPRGSGSTTVSAASSPPRDDSSLDDHDQPDQPRKKTRKQNHANNEGKQMDFQTEESPPESPPVTIKPQKRPQLSRSYVCGWRSTALHFVRPADVRRREPKNKDLASLAAQKHVLNTADGWKVHHITAQMDDLVSLESDVGEQLEGVLRSLENVSGKAVSALKPHAHTLLELLKGNIQRSKIMCEGIQEARGDILRVFNHRGFVSDILARQADKRSFRKHRSQS